MAVSLWIAIVNLAVYVITIIANALTGTSIGDTSNLYSLSITPPSYSFIIWAYIFGSLGVFSVATLIDSLYGTAPVDMTDTSVIALAIGNLFNAAWPSMFTGGNLLNSFLLLLALTVSLFISYFSSLTTSFSFYLSFVIGLYVGWTLAATVLNLFIYMKYQIGIVNTDAIASVAVYIVYIASIAAWYIAHSPVESGFNQNFWGFVVSQTWAILAVTLRLLGVVS